MRLNRFLPLALVTTFAVLLLLFGFAAVTYRERSNAESWRARTYLVLLETGAMRSGLAEAQTNLRGFLLTRDDAFVARFYKHNESFKDSQKAMLKLVDDNREQGIRIERVQNTYQNWENAARRQIALQHRGGSTPGTRQAQQERAFKQGSALAEQVRALLNRIDTHERNLLAQRMKSATTLQQRSERILLVGSVLGALTLGVLSFLLVFDARELERARQRLEAENTERRRAESEIRIANDSLAAQLARIERRNGEIELLSDCGQLLQACQTIDEACNVVRQVAPRLFPSTFGAVYVFNASGNFLERIIHWRPATENREIERIDESIMPEQLQRDDCWALRCGQKHRFERDAATVACPHLPSPHPAVSLCVPLLAQGNVLGLLNIYDEQTASLDASDGLLALAAGEQIGLAISNLQLRETLRHQSIRDPLTNLYNRRYLEESLEHELQRATRTRQTVGVIMIDIDFFKRFNDSHGHAAGDLLLQAVANCLQEGTRGGDIACRYGGEELTLILPEATCAQTLARAEKLRCDIEKTQVQYQGQVLGPVTISAGVACFPEDARSTESLLKAADAALYQAKSNGRNRVFTRETHGSTPGLSARLGEEK